MVSLNQEQNEVYMVYILPFVPLSRVSALSHLILVVTLRQAACIVISLSLQMSKLSHRQVRKVRKATCKRQSWDLSPVSVS